MFSKVAGGNFTNLRKDTDTDTEEQKSQRNSQMKSSKVTSEMYYDPTMKKCKAKRDF